MSPSSLLRSIALLTLAATPLITAPSAARAQGLIDFLWGGTDEWGGKRQVIDFDAKYTPNQIIVSFGDRRLYLITQKGKAISYPIAVPREQSRWQGTTAVSEKKENPAWRPTPDMLRENPKLPTWVPGGHPMNPLGVRAIYLGASTYRIHGTDSPWTIGQAVSKGCVRMYNEDVLDLYPRVPVGMKVTVTWQEFGTHEMASNDDSPSPFIYDPSPPGTSSRGGVRATRNVASTPPPATKPGLTPDNVGFNNKLPPPDPSTDDKPSKPVAKAKPKAKAPETATAPAAAKSAAPAATAAKADMPDAAAAATKAAAAATRAAESARAAAEAAKKAAEDAKKATSADGNKDAVTDDKHAAL